MININKIVKFDHEYINNILLIYKYSNAINEIKSYLSIEKDFYDITRFVERFNTKPIYVDKEINSSIIIFEYIFGINIRNSQYDFVQKLYREILNKDKPNLHQMLMGEGKSSVIAPILTLELLLNKELKDSQQIYHVMPESLTRQSFNIFSKLIYYLGYLDIFTLGYNSLFENITLPSSGAVLGRVDQSRPSSSRKSLKNE